MDREIVDINLDDLNSLKRIKAFVENEGFTGGKILDAVNEYIKYVEQGGTL